MKGGKELEKRVLHRPQQLLSPGWRAHNNTLFEHKQQSNGTLPYVMSASDLAILRGSPCEAVIGCRQADTVLYVAHINPACPGWIGSLLYCTLITEPRGGRPTSAKKLRTGNTVRLRSHLVRRKLGPVSRRRLNAVYAPSSLAGRVRGIIAPPHPLAKLTGSKVHVMNAPVATHGTRCTGNAVWRSAPTDFRVSVT